MSNLKFYVMGDIHGDYKSLMLLMRLIRKNGFSFKKGHRLVQLGDRCDRGPDTFRVNNYFYKLEKRYPGQVICLKGNHEQMMLDAAFGIEEWGFLNNSGKATMKSYKCHSNNPQVLMYKLQDCGHLKWLDAQPYWYETEDYLFTHAPIPYEGMGARRVNTNFRDSKEVCFWSYGGETLEDWVDPDPTTEGKISVHGHIHGLKRRKADGEYEAPGIRVIGNAYMIDTGAGCHPTAGYLTALMLPDMIAYTSRGEILDGIKVEEKEE
jgi:serine/threonine protein phosphatase 1